MPTELENNNKIYYNIMNTINSCNKLICEIYKFVYNIYIIITFSLIVFFNIHQMATIGLWFII